MSKKIVAVSAKKISPYAIPGICLSVEIVEYAACSTWQVERKELYEKTKKREVVETRHSVFAFLMELGYRPRQIIRDTCFNQATVYYARHKVDELLGVDRGFRQKHTVFINKIKATIKIQKKLTSYANHRALY